jgi:hypothetical protein
MNRRSFLHGTAGTAALRILVSRRACLNAQEVRPGPAVETRPGRVRGLASRGFIAFKGRRDGAWSTGDNLFQVPVRPRAWTGVRTL